MQIIKHRVLRDLRITHLHFTSPLWKTKIPTLKKQTFKCILYNINDYDPIDLGAIANGRLLLNNYYT